ncbi:MmpS family transport accessory protein [Streptomyces sp. 35G-GA-8]|uniref:MmpS family transport accessory protein n=1 Tax=Streptomyces sp. 35G-GA-8 TaxID=2939434 RepID=UPI00201EE6AE|nr:MmpS family transport accessory protein [Streptomyces sp. 35G-GA-8]MCL7378316.1 MmpS family transport accessory protein [Streptomyces sp. 35G-GA-8]
MPTTEERAGLEEPETPDTTRVSPAPDSRRIIRGGIAVAATLLLAGGAFVTYGVLDSEDKSADKRAEAPTAEVTYEVLGEGAADISYRGADGDKADVVTNVGLPWKKTVSVPLGASPIVNVILGEKGGTASCTLTVRGKHVQRATATGAFGRTTCSGDLPSPEASGTLEGTP